MNAFDLYCKYLSIKTHFTNETFDYSKYGDNKKVSVQTFYKRKDQFHFTKLSRKYASVDIEDFLIANFIENPNIWVGDLLSQSSDDIYLNYRKIKDSMFYFFQADVEKIVEYCNSKNVNFNSLFQCNDDYPIITKMVMRKEINYQTFVILDIMLNFNFEEKFKDDIIWKETMLKYYKYKKLIKVSDDEIKNYRKITKSAIKSLVVV